MINATDLTSRSSGKKQLEYVTVFSNSKERKMLPFWDKHFNCKWQFSVQSLVNQPIHLYLKKNVYNRGNRSCVQKGSTKAFICN